MTKASAESPNVAGSLGTAGSLSATWPAPVRLLGKAAFRTMGFQLKGELPATRKFVLVGAPHTSNWDGFWTYALSFATGVKVHWVGKHTLFKGPLGKLARASGGIPLDRRSRQNFVEQMIQRFQDSDEFVLAVAPEGTRKRADRWKTGFYWIAVGAKVPIVLGYADYAKKVVGFGPTLWPTGDIEKDFAVMREFYSTVTPRFAENFGPVQP